MKQHLAILAFGLVLGMGSQPGQAATFALPSSIRDGLLSLQFSGEDLNNDGNLALEELTDYQANWLGTEQDPAFSHTKNNLTSFNYQYGNTLLDSTDDLSLSLVSNQPDEYSTIDITGTQTGVFEEVCDPECHSVPIFTSWVWAVSVTNWPPPPPPPEPIVLPPGVICACFTFVTLWPPVGLTEFIQDGERLTVLPESNNNNNASPISVPEPNLNIMLAILGLGGLLRKVRFQK